MEMRRFAARGMVILLAIGCVISAGCEGQEQREDTAMLEAVERHVETTKSWPKADYSIEMNRVEDGNWVFWVIHSDDANDGRVGGGKSIEVHVDPNTKKVVEELGFQ